MNKWARLVMPLLLLILAGCGLPDEIKTRAKGLTDEFTKAEGIIASQKAAYEATKKGEEYIGFFSKYAEREKWDNSFDLAAASLKKARQIADTSLKSVIDRNKEAETQLAWDELKRVNEAKREAVELANVPERRMKLLREAKTQAPEWLKKARSEMAALSTAFARADKGIQGALSRHPQRKLDIEKRSSAVSTGHTLARQQLTSAEGELKEQLPDYAKFADACSGISQNLKTVTTGEAPLVAKLAELDRGYSKTLIDMRAEYFVKIGRVSWHESEAIEWPTETEHSYQLRPVDEATYDYFAALPDDNTLATMRSGWSSSKMAVADGGNQAMWDKLRIDPKENWPGSDNEADYFIDDVPAKYFHKYAVVENGVRKDSDWIEVADDYFEKHDEDLGMDVVAKPLGMFEDEASNVAAPAAMAYVGNPAYGQWRNGPQGGFWEFYGKYRLLNDLIGLAPYNRSEYDSWNRDYRGRRPYYGPGEEERYGSGGSATNRAYGGSHYARSGGFKAGDHSVRGAGSSARGGGPGGGGK